MSPIPDWAPPLFGRDGWAPPASFHTYGDAEGRPLFHVARYPLPRGGFTRTPMVLRREGPGLVWWCAENFPAPRPLYRLAALASRPAAPVLVVAGDEAAADELAAAFPEFAVTTWCGGFKGLCRADFAPLAHREVVVWGRRGGRPGMQTLEAARCATRAGAVSVAIARPRT